MRSALLLAMLPAVAFAQTVYSWEDTDGLHYTDDLSAVPRGAKGVRAVTVQADPPMSAAPAVKRAEPAPAAAPATSREPDEATWRRRFVDGFQRIASLNAHIRSARAALPEPVLCRPVPQLQAAGAPRGAPVAHCRPNPEYERQVAQIAQLEADVVDAQAHLQQLEREASYAAVPREWRRGY